MTAELVIIIIGALLILLVLLDAIRSLNLIDSKLRIPLGLIGFVLLIFGGYSYGSVNHAPQMEDVKVATKKEVDYPVNRVQVISPIEGDQVDCRTLTMGVYPDGNEKDIWVLLKPSDEKYYPQSDHTNTSFKREGKWQVITRYGGDQNEEYEVIVFEANQEASAFFTETIQQWKDAGSYPGLTDEQLPAGATEVDRITVSLKNNCRGVF